MANLSHHLEKVARWSKFAGIVDVVSFSFVSVFAILSGVNRLDINDPKITIIAAVVWTTLYLLPGILLWVFGHLLGSGKIWAFVPIAGLAIFELLKVLVARILSGSLNRFPLGGVCTLWLRLPTLILMAYMLNALPDARDHFRRRRREQKPRGFAVIANRPPTVTPPPPARFNIRKPTR